MMDRKHHRFGACCVLALLLVAPCFGQSAATAQEPTSEVTGVVTDATRAVIPHAKITFSNDAGKITTQADDAGRFHANLRSGRYVAVATSRGFKKAEFGDFQVQAPNPVSLDVTLQCCEQVFSGPQIVIGPATTASELPLLIEEAPVQFQPEVATKSSKSRMHTRKKDTKTSTPSTPQK